MGMVCPATGAIQDFHPGQPRQAKVKDDQVEALVLQCLIRRMTIPQPVDRKARLAQADRQAIAQFWIIFD